MRAISVNRIKLLILYRETERVFSRDSMTCDLGVKKNVKTAHERLCF